MEAPPGMRQVGWWLEGSGHILGGYYKTESLARKVAEYHKVRMWPVWVDARAREDEYETRGEG